MGGARIGRCLAAMAMVLFLVVVVAACGGGGSSSSSESTEAGSTTAEEASTTGEEGGGGGETKLVAEAEAFVEEMAPGANSLPTSSPKPPTGLNVWAIPCLAAAQGCEDPIEGLKAAAKVLGWNVTEFDGKGDPAQWAAGINQAVAAGADAIVTASVDCAPVKSALEKAKAAGVMTINVNGFDCDSVGGEKLFTYTVEPEEGVESWKQPALTSGEIQAAWAIAHSNGEVKAIQLTNEEQEITVNLGAGFREYLKKCSTCELLEEVEFSLAELGDPLTPKTSSALLSNPSANYVVAPYDPAAFPAAQAVIQAGKTSSVQVLGAIGEQADIELIREGRGQSMSVGWDEPWLGWAAADSIVRLSDKQKPVYSGWALGLVDKEHLPEGARYHGPAEYEANYEKIWKGQ